MRPLHGSTYSDSGQHSRHLCVAEWMGGGIVGVAVLLQFIVLGGRTPLAVAAGVGAALLSAGLWVRREWWPHAAALVTTTALGGAAMLGGGLLGGGAADHSHAHGGMMHADAGPLLWSPATAAMLVACVAGLHWSGCARSGGGGWRMGMLHAFCAAAMLGGMVATGPRLGPVLSPRLGAAAGTHLAMLIGMAAGSALVLALVGGVNRRSGARLRLGDALRGRVGAG